MTETQEAEVAPVEPLVAAWRSELDGQVSVAASHVQDHLLDLWGLLPDGDARAQVELWLTETLERNLYVAAEVDDRLSRVIPQS